MIQLIFFVIACLAWQAIKNAVRGEVKPRVTLPVPKKAECGCSLIGTTVVNICAAHKVLLNLCD